MVDENGISLRGRGRMKWSGVTRGFLPPTPPNKKIGILYRVTRKLMQVGSWSQ